jgi:hypothetical protein
MSSHRSGPPATPIILTALEMRILEKFKTARKTDQGLAVRAEIIILACRRRANTKIARLLNISTPTVILWRTRYAEVSPKILSLVQQNAAEIDIRTLIVETLQDAPRPGTPCRITSEQKIALIALACEKLPQEGLPQSQWDAPTLAAEAIKRGVVLDISPSWVSRILAKADIHPHKMKY